MAAIVNNLECMRRRARKVRWLSPAGRAYRGMIRLASWDTAKRKKPRRRQLTTYRLYTVPRASN